MSVPAIEVAPEGRVSAGSVYIVLVEDGDIRPQLPSGKQVVVETDSGRLELLTLASATGGMEEEGTYLAAEDVDRLGQDPTNPTLRLYRWKDTWRKVRSYRGTLLLLSALIGFVAAGGGVYFAVFGGDPTSAATVSDRASVAIQWVGEPVDRLDAQASPKTIEATRRETHQRAVEASRCLQRVGGRAAPPATVPLVTCESASPVWYRRRDNADWVTLAAGLLMALLSVLGLKGGYGFQRNPGGP